MDASEFKRLLDDCNYEYRSYSGRGMHGKYCVAVVTDDNPVMFGANLMFGLDESTQDELIQRLGYTNIDTMGYATVYYWPNLIWEE